MASMKLNGIILSESNVGDFDKMLTMLTPGIRKNFVRAKGARRPKSALFSRHANVLLWRIFGI